MELLEAPIRRGLRNGSGREYLRDQERDVVVVYQVVEWCRVQGVDEADAISPARQNPPVQRIVSWLGIIVPVYPVPVVGHPGVEGGRDVAGFGGEHAGFPQQPGDVRGWSGRGEHPQYPGRNLVGLDDDGAPWSAVCEGGKAL